MTDTRTAQGGSAAMRERLARLEGYLQRDPHNTALLSDAFDTALAAGEFAAAQRFVDQAAALFDAQPEQRPYWQFREATLCMTTGRDVEAQQLLEALLEQGIDDPAVVSNLAQLAYRHGEDERALALLQPLAARHDLPDATAALLLRTWHRLAKLDEAMQWVGGRFAAPVPATQPGVTWVGVGSLIALDAGQAAEAKTWSEQALAGDDRQMEALVVRATIALGEDDGRLAHALLERALTINPRDGRTWSTLAFVDMLDGRLDVAEAHFQRSLETMPNHIGTWHGLGWCYLIQRDLARAQAAFAASLEIDRNFGETHGGLAVIAALEGRRDEAQASIARALGLDATSLSARYAQALLAGEASDPQAIVRLSRRLLGARAGGQALQVARRIEGAAG
ncbi:tetratricopeptide repeat protein [Trinickia fusca]|nr:tetratricopeptide repeat protein [Trinickia fusca]